MPLKPRIFLSCDRPIAPDCDRCVLKLLLPHLEPAAADKLEDRHIQQLLNQFKQGLDWDYVSRSAVDGQVHSNVLSPQSSLQREQSGRQVLVRLVPAPSRDYYLLLLEEQQSSSFSIAALESLGLTQREAEVLFWVAKDKSNAAIARVLDCCEGTVRKHLERLYRKLGVQTRMGAVMTALERLGLLQP